ncbi:membrane protein [Microbacterium phage Etna]|uniref:Membrane protein n=1 Tax=Microbacterium phage Etna TaxID=2126930 RepID=A0A2R3ZZY2_9CAUD|nr:membrane protein [Microbacterium phage Etna]
MTTFDELLVVDEEPTATERVRSGVLAFFVGVSLVLAGLGVIGVALWLIGQFFWWLFLVFLQGAGPSTGNFQDPSYANFLE